MGNVGRVMSNVEHGTRLWILVGMDLNLVAFVTVLLTETRRLDSRRVDTLGLNVRMQSSGSNHCE